MGQLARATTGLLRGLLLILLPGVGLGLVLPGCSFFPAGTPFPPPDSDAKQADLPGTTSLDSNLCQTSGTETIPAVNDTPCGAVLSEGSSQAFRSCLADAPDDLVKIDDDSGFTSSDCAPEAASQVICYDSGCVECNPDGTTTELDADLEDLCTSEINVVRATGDGHVLVGCDRIVRCDLESGECQETQGIPAGAGSVQEILETPNRIFARIDGTPDSLYSSVDLGLRWERQAIPGDPVLTDIETEDDGTVHFTGPAYGIGTFRPGSTTPALPDIGLARPFDGTAMAAPHTAGAAALVVAAFKDGVQRIRVVDSTGNRAGTAPTIQGVEQRVLGLRFGTKIAFGRPQPLADPLPPLFASTIGGVFRSDDGAQTWTPIRGIATATVTRVLPTDTGVLAGTFGNASAVYRSTDDGETWTPASAVLVNQIARAMAAVGANVVASGETGIFRSTDGGTTWVRGVAGLPAGTYFFGMTALGNVMLGGSVYLNATSPGGIYRSTDGGATWTSSGQGLPININVASLAVSGNLVVATVQTSSARILYRSTDGGLTWSAGASFAQGAPGALAFSGGALFLGLTGTADAHLFRSTDGGLTFTPSDSGLANRRVLSLAAADGAIFAGTYAGLYWSTDGGASWREFTSRLRGIQVFSVATTSDRVYAGTVRASLWSFRLPPRQRRLVPIVLDVDTGATRFRSELLLTNAGAAPVGLTLRYTSSIGSGSGEASDNLAAGEQKVIPDAISYLRGKGVPIPESGSQGGTLLVTFGGPVDGRLVSVTARTAAATLAPQPVGSAGLAYVGRDPAEGFTSRVVVYGLREDATDRSNFAVYNTTGEPVTMRVTARSGAGDGTSVVVAEAETLPPYGWKQYNRILGGAGMTSGYVVVERTSATGAFGCYGVINDNGTNDGSFLEPTAGFLVPYLNVPVLVETPAFLSELVLANSGGTTARLALSYRESLDAAGGAGSFQLDLPAGRQMIIPGAIDFLRSRGVAIGARGAASYAGALHVTVEGASISDVWAGARTASLSPADGQFGLFTPGLFAGGEVLGSATLYGLLANADNRSNVAVVNTATRAASGSITLSLQAHDGDAAGAARGDPEVVTLGPGQWRQLGGFLAGRGVANGWVTITRTSGSAPWIAYGVINDGGAPGQRTGDGAYVPMTR